MVLSGTPGVFVYFAKMKPDENLQVQTSELLISYKVAAPNHHFRTTSFALRMALCVVTAVRL